MVNDVLIALKTLPPAFMVFSGTIVMAESDIAIPGGQLTAVGALAGGFTMMLATLVWIVKKQLETFPQALKEQQDSFTKSLKEQTDAYSRSQEQQNLTFAAIFDKVREDNQKTLNLIRDEHK